LSESFFSINGKGLEGSLTKDGIAGIHGHLVLSGVSNETLGVCKGHITWGSAIALVVGDDFHLSVLENSDAGVGGSKIDTDCGSRLCHFCATKSKKILV
jgi:hypothetical protein